MGGFFVGDLSISNGALTYLDGETGKLTTVTIGDLGLKARDPQSPVDATFRGSVDDTAIAVDGTLGPLASLAKEQWPYPVNVKGQVKAQQVSLDTKLRVQDGTTTLDPLELGVGKSKVTGQLSITPASRGPNWCSSSRRPRLRSRRLRCRPRVQRRRPRPR